MRVVLKRTRWLLLYPLLSCNQWVWSCAVCGTATAASEKAYIFSTMFLSLIPLLMIGAVMYYLYWVSTRKQQ